ncbi:hypothetical protein XELAEV_18008803mg [Xenopus laevis]|uniref:Uncharacterized protein n=1 Tax=Xenopus laevis TaxID=8355 RepID=A0A974DTL5_XENLA|nr:hypothetical protein XELAEV_18008803mg [Xenopus laevis]
MCRFNRNMRGPLFEISPHVISESIQLLFISNMREMSAWGSSIINLFRLHAIMTLSFLAVHTAVLLQL